MKRSKKTKRVVILLCLCLVLCLLAGCGKKKSSGRFIDLIDGKTTESGNNWPWSTTESLSTEQPPTEEYTSEEPPTEELTTGEPPTEQPPTQPGRIENSAYVMIYNPLQYDEYDYDTESKTSLNTGSIGDQIKAGSNRADGTGTDHPFMISQREWELPEIKKKPNNRSGGLNPVYSKGDNKEFYIYGDDMTATGRHKQSFKCVYDGTHCYVWDMDGSLTEKQAKAFGEEFDSFIFEKDEKAFGKGRFTENGGKVNILFQPMASPGLLGFFTPLDIFATEEMDPKYVDMYGFNLDHAIININSLYASETQTINATLAHEYQHLICMTSTVETNCNRDNIRTWLNESMSAYAEELVYPGTKGERDYDLEFYYSKNYSRGQSLFNFSHEGDETIGDYGVVYMFEEYLTESAGEDVFTKVHSNWRSSSDFTPDEAQLIYNSVPSKVQNDITSRWVYPASVSGKMTSNYQEWMSKLTLDFYLYCLRQDKVQNNSLVHDSMVYPEINPCNIEGGGRIIVELKNGSFDIPDDADSGLVYIGLDRDYNPVTGIVTK